MTPTHGSVESRCVKMLFEIEGYNMARLCANTVQGCLLEEIAARGLSLFLAGRDKRGEAGTRGGRTWAPRCGQGSGRVFGIA